jgi:hypothetical protein
MKTSRHVTFSARSRYPRYRESKIAGLICFNLLKPTGYVIHQQFNIQQLYVLPHTLYLWVLYLSENKQRFASHHKLIGFYNRDEKCFLLGTKCFFK